MLAWLPVLLYSSKSSWFEFQCHSIMVYFKYCYDLQIYYFHHLWLTLDFILLQQFSILVLLARPQHIHMNPPVDFMNRMDSGVTRSPSDIAWLEKRVHHLKDEMYMVETRLERMRYEHALLKKQLKDLEHK